MITHVGVDILGSRVFLYNSTDKSIRDFDIEKVSGNDVDRIEAVIQNIKSNIIGELGCICFLLLRSGYGNEIRKKIINSCVTEGYKAVEMLDFHSAKYINAIFESGFKIKDGDILWLFEGTTYYIWKKIGQKAVLIFHGFTDIVENKNFEQIKNRSKQNQNPKYLLCNIKMDEGLLREVFSDVNIYYYRSKTWRNSVVTKARIMAGDPEVTDYDTNAATFSNTVTKIGEKRIMDFYYDFSLPSTKAIHIEHEETENCLSIFTGQNESEKTELPMQKEFVLTVTMNTTGIYDVQYHKPSINKSVLDKFYSEAEDYFKNNNMRYFIPQQLNTYCNRVDHVGIDLGATRCCVAVNRQSGMETIPLDNTGERHLPSYIAFEEKHDKCGKIVVQWVLIVSVIFLHVFARFCTYLHVFALFVIKA